MDETKENEIKALQERIRTQEKKIEQMKSLFHLKEECSICLTELEPFGKALFRTACGHVFHFQCVKKCVLANQNACPLCRKSFSDMTPPRTPLTRRNENSIFPGFRTARETMEESFRDLDILSTPVTNSRATTPGHRYSSQNSSSSSSSSEERIEQRRLFQ